MNRSHLAAILMTLILAGCQAQNARVATTLNQDAVLAGDMSIDPLSWKTITSGFNPHDSTMFTLFGNDSAVEYARTSGGRDYPRSSVLALVTWRQQEDSRWFGARIPAQPKSVEVVTVAASEDGGTTYVYRSFKGVPLKEIQTSEMRANERATYVLSKRAAVMP